MRHHNIVFLIYFVWTLLTIIVGIYVFKSASDTQNSYIKVLQEIDNG